MAETKNAIPTELGTEKIGRLLKQYALPAIIAQTASSLYNMVDSIFIGQGVGPLAISGLAVTFPLMNLSTAFGTLVGAGAATMLSVLLGQIIQKFLHITKIHCIHGGSMFITHLHLYHISIFSKNRTF